MSLPANILIRLPNWLGDMVMSTAFVQAVSNEFPGSSIDVIAKKELAFLLDFFPAIQSRYLFDKNEYKGAGGAWRFGKNIGYKKKYDLLFCLPDSFSSALMARATGSKHAIGYKGQLRNGVLTHTYKKPSGLHRVQEYLTLLENYRHIRVKDAEVILRTDPVQHTDAIVININSEAQSRRLTQEKAIRIVSSVRKAVDNPIILVGSPKEKEFVTGVYNGLSVSNGIENKAGATTIPELIALFSAAKLVLSTDSGPAHLANAVQTNTIVLFGAGNEMNTAPFNKKNCTVVRLGQLPCEPCTKNVCTVFSRPECLERIPEELILTKIQQYL